MRGFFRSALLGASLAAAMPAPEPVPVPDASPVELVKRANPTVTIASGSIVGAAKSATDNFNGIPFALPPTGSLRLKPPVKLNTTLGTFDATGTENACPQMLLSTGSGGFLTEVLADVIDLPFFQTALKISEDCLTINVIRPKGATSTSKLPVLFWIFGGGFEVCPQISSSLASCQLRLH
jgi:carboxylesterase type B